MRIAARAELVELLREAGAVLRELDHIQAGPPYLTDRIDAALAPRPPLSRTPRNVSIYEARLHGATYKGLAVEHDITISRVRNLARREWERLAKPLSAHFRPSQDDPGLARWREVFLC